MTPSLTDRGGRVVADDAYDDPFDGADWVDCWQCGGEGFVGDCWDGFCVLAESGCDACTHRCDICHGKGGWEPSERQSATNIDALPTLSTEERGRP